jgi:nicotinate phosphoribosyltransferase
MPAALYTDLYELNMAASYLRRGMTQPATFSLFVRTMPPQRGFLVAAGLEAALEFLEDLRFTDTDLDYLRDELHFAARDLEALRHLRFDGDVWAVPEGTIILANEPILEVSASLPTAQLIETPLLNHVTTQTILASKAARYRLAAGDADLVDFAFRRTHGIEAAMVVARTSAMAGFVATSNVEAARRFGLRASGTMAHSYVEAFDAEADAFRAFAQDFPDRTTFLVDTYDTLNGVRTVVDVIRELDLVGNLAIRLDSGDLAALSRGARAILDRAGLTGVRIIASGGLDEVRVESLVRSGAPIDAFGVGTQLGVSADAPALDSVYKLVRIGGRPVLKLSADKATMPGEKQVFRSRSADVLGLRSEDPPAGTGPLMEPVMRRGRRLRAAPPLDQGRSQLESDLSWLPPAARRLTSPAAPVPHVSHELESLSARTRALALERLHPRADAEQGPIPKES